MAIKGSTCYKEYSHYRITWIYDSMIVVILVCERVFAGRCKSCCSGIYRGIYPAVEGLTWGGGV